MNEHPDISSAFNLVLCYRAHGVQDLMKDGFQKLLEVAAEQKKMIKNTAGTSGVTSAIDDILSSSTNAGILGPDGNNNILITDALGANSSGQKQLEKDELSKEIQRREDKLNRFILYAAKVIIPVIENDIFLAYDYVSNLLRKENHLSLAAQIDMSKATECLQRGETEKALEMLKSFTRGNDTLASSAFQNLSFVLFLEVFSEFCYFYFYYLYINFYIKKSIGREIIPKQNSMPS
jgi:hypothetical protein